METDKLKFNDKLFMILNKNDSEYRKKDRKVKPMIYHLPKNFTNNEKYQDCKVAIFELKEIVDIKEYKKRLK